ncbi:MAG: outer membrane protein assembly factor BamA [Nitrospirae bacterium]|nr:outer membrane protein assembly factor BamA [Nitrospirota bacterium]
MGGPVNGGVGRRGRISIITAGLLIGLAAGWGGGWATAAEDRGVHSPPPGVIVKRIDIAGLHKIAETTVRGQLPVQEGAPFSVDGVRRIIEAIYRLGYFDDVQVATEGYEGGLKLLITVTERPTLRDIRYEGYDQLAVDKLKEQVTIQSGTFLDLQALTKATNKLTAYYHNQGYYHAQVRTVLQETKPGDVALTFVISEGSRAKIRSITFQGNRAFSARQLRNVIETKEYFWLSSWLTDSGLYQTETAAADIDRLKEHYLDRGYMQVQVGAPQATLSKDRRWFDLMFPVEEGDRYTIASVAISGAQILSEAAVRSAISTTTGTLFNRSQIRRDILAVTEAYGERGYAFAQVTPQLSPDPASKQVAVEFQIQEGRQVHIRRINITGNAKTRDKVIRRELRVDEQGLLDTRALKRSFERLNNLNFFESVEIAPDTIQDDLVDLEVRIKEKPTGTFSVGGGYSSVDKIIGTVDITQGNLFGRGQMLRLQGQLGGVSSSYSLTFRDPYFLDYRLSVATSIFNQKREFDTYTEQRVGGSLTFGKNFTEYLSGNVGYQLQQLDLSHLKPGQTPTLVLQQRGLSATSELRTALAWDSRDVYLAPSRGSRHALSFDYAGTFLGGDNDFYKVVADSSVYFPLWWETVFSVRGRFGFAHPLTVDGTLPVGERFFVGGIDTVRGFDYGDAGPKSGNDVIGGNKELIVNLEYVFPLVPAAKVRGVLFFDAGKGFDFGESIQFSALRTSVGAGIRLYLPIGPIRVEWGYILGRKPEDHWRPIEFTIGTQF